MTRLRVGILLLGLMPVLQGHTGDMLAALNCIQDVQIITVGLDMTSWTFAASCTAHTATAVTLRCVPELSGMHPSQDTFKASASMLAFLVW